MRHAARVAGQGLSPIRRMSLGAPPDAINLGLGEPGWALPAVAAEALARFGPGSGPVGGDQAGGEQAGGEQAGGEQASGAPLPYGPNSSDPALVAAILDRARAGSRMAGGRDRREAMVTSGSQAALFALFTAYVDPGTVVLVPDPGFVAYATLARLCGATPVGYPLHADGDLDADALVEVLGEQRHTSLVVLNHPANPTGGLASADALARVAEACAARGILLISDEVYAELWLDEQPPGLHEVTGGDGGAVVLGSVSKAYGAPGLRVGWALGDADVLAPARLVHNAMTTAPARPSQAAARALLEASEEVLPAARAQISERWATVDRVAPHLRRAGPQKAGSRTGGRAGFYLWLPVPTEPRRSDPASTEAFALRLRDEGGVTTIPGTAFGPRGAGHLRVSLGGPVDDLEEGLRRLAPWWKA